MALIDYQKAYDRAPHGWLQLVTGLGENPSTKERSEVHPPVERKWKTDFSAGDKKVVGVDLTLKRGLVSLGPPLLFCLSILPLSHALRENGEGFKEYGLEIPITHLLFMDDLKVYAKGKADLSKVVRLVDRTSEEMGMTMGLRKCAVAHMRNGKSQTGLDLMLPGDRQAWTVKIPGSYRYLGVMQLFDPKLRTVKKQLKEEYLRRVGEVWSTELSSRHKVNATDTLAVALFRYFFPCIRWYRRPLMILDRDTHDQY